MAKRPTPPRRAQAAPAARRRHEPAEIIARLHDREVLVLVRAIWSPSLQRRLDPPMIVRVDGATADWLRDTGRAGTPRGGNASKLRPRDLGKDHAIPSENAEPGERTWAIYELTPRSPELAAGEYSLVLDGHRYHLLAGRRPRGDEGPALVVDEHVQPGDPHYPGEKTVRCQFRVAPEGDGDPGGAAAALREHLRRGSVAGTIEASRRALPNIRNCPEHDEALGLLDAAEREFHLRAGPLGQLPAAVAVLLRERLERIVLLIRAGLRRADTLKATQDRGRRKAAAGRKEKAAAVERAVVEKAAAYRDAGRAPCDIAALVARALDMSTQRVRSILRRTR